ncbi:hypothetical protein CIHG_02198 [Coccidioides immitis H538.4]|uniref:Uncharacterized protein n=1 Tax=Coccidioides immitis H538.4 TaxID=396776 RepID=A0A0J8UBC5_COCIT|nr:hypothetical protein CIHG_02198 [Coccidioides immitis H538.4]
MWWKRRWHRRLTRLAFVSMLGSSLIQEAHGAECAATAVKVPDYVLKYAPLVWTHSEDPYQPSDIATHVENTIPQIKYEPVQGVPSPLTLDNLDELNALGGTDIFLTSKEGIRALPPWLQGVRPNKNGKTEGALQRQPRRLRNGGMMPWILPESMTQALCTSPKVASWDSITYPTLDSLA